MSDTLIHIDIARVADHYELLCGAPVTQAEQESALWADSTKRPLEIDLAAVTCPRCKAVAELVNGGLSVDLARRGAPETHLAATHPRITGDMTVRDAASIRGRKGGQAVKRARKAGAK